MEERRDVVECPGGGGGGLESQHEEENELQAKEKERAGKVWRKSGSSERRRKKTGETRAEVGVFQGRWRATDKGKEGRESEYLERLLE